MIRLLSNGRIQLVVFDDKSKERVYLTSTTALTANNDYNIAFTITGHTGNSNVTRKPGCVESTFINNVARLYVFPTSSDRVPDPEDNNATDIYNVAVSGYSNPIHFGNSERSNQPFFGKIKIMGGYSLSLNKDQLKIAFDPNL